jgi:hypothetical protein
VENFTHVTTFGEAQNHWISATVDPDDLNIFTFHQHVVAANLPRLRATLLTRLGLVHHRSAAWACR